MLCNIADNQFVMLNTIENYHTFVKKIVRISHHQRCHPFLSKSPLFSKLLSEVIVDKQCKKGNSWWHSIRTVILWQAIKQRHLSNFSITDASNDSRVHLEEASAYLWNYWNFVSLCEYIVITQGYGGIWKIPAIWIPVSFKEWQPRGQIKTLL